MFSLILILIHRICCTEPSNRLFLDFKASLIVFTLKLCVSCHQTHNPPPTPNPHPQPPTPTPNPNSQPLPPTPTPNPYPQPLPPTPRPLQGLMLQILRLISPKKPKPCGCCLTNEMLFLFVCVFFTIYRKLAVTRISVKMTPLCLWQLI